MATKSLGLATPLQIMRKVLFQLYTFFASQVARKYQKTAGQNELRPYGHKGFPVSGRSGEWGVFVLANV
jgi:hypothetical protein